MKRTNEQQRAGKRKTIYFIWNYLEWGGVQIYFLGLMRRASEKFRVKVILPAESSEKILEYLRANDIPYEFYAGKTIFSSGGGVWEKIKRRGHLLISNWRLARHLFKRELANSIVQIDVAPWSGFLLLLYLSVKTDVFVTFHTAIAPLDFINLNLLKIKFAILNRFKRFHIVSSNLDVKKSLQPFVDATRYERIEVVYSSVNTREIEAALNGISTRREIADRYGFPAEKKWICNVAQFIERKGCWVFLEMIEKLRRERNDLFFFWLGTLPLDEAVEKKIEVYDLGESFRFLSAAETGGTRQDLLRLWKSADMFVLPSFQEGLPVALIEAMALGLPCVASNVNAIPEAVVSFETGILVAAGDSARLAATVEDLADDALLRERLGKNARDFVLDNFEEAITGNKMVALYESVR